jgi:hypothetical protein
MRTLKARLLLAVGLVLASPLAAMAADPDGTDTIWEWIVRMLTWAAGSWHLY